MARLDNSPTSIVPSTILLPSSLIRAPIGRPFLTPLRRSTRQHQARESIPQGPRRLRAGRPHGWQAGAAHTVEVDFPMGVPSEDIPPQHKTGTVVQGCRELDTGDEPCTVVLTESVRAAFRKAVWKHIFIHQVDVGAVLLRCKRKPDDPTAFVIPSGGLDCSKQQMSQVQTLKARAAAYELPTSHDWSWSTSSCYRHAWRPARQLPALTSRTAMRQSWCRTLTSRS